MATQIKVSNIKTKISLDEVRDFVATKLEGIDEVKNLSEGYVSQSYSFAHTDGKRRVLRFTKEEEGFLKDQYAYNNFSSIDLPIPKVYEVGKYSENIYYCVSEFVDGVTSDKLSDDQMQESLESQLDSFASIFKKDIKGTLGWGEVDISTGNGESKSWKECFMNEIDGLDDDSMIKGLKTVGLDKSILQKLKDQFYENMVKLNDPERRLIHGDLGFDNVLVSNGKVSAIIDWADFQYGDWVYEYSRFDFWWQGRYPSIQDFGKLYQLDLENLEERIRASTAYIALTTIDWAVQNESPTTLEDLKSMLPLITGL